MKTTAILMAFAFLILDVQGARDKTDPGYFFKMSAAQVSAYRLSVTFLHNTKSFFYRNVKKDSYIKDLDFNSQSVQSIP